MKKKRRERRKFSPEFKEETVKLVLEQGMTRTQVAQDLDIGQQMLSYWIRNYRRSKMPVYADNGELSLEGQKIKQLEAEVKRLRMERDILKKATAFFANHSE